MYKALGPILNKVAPLRSEVITDKGHQLERWQELSMAIDNKASGKVPGRDRIPPDLIRHCKTTLCILCMWSFVSAGKKELYHKTEGTPRSSLSSKTRERAVTATTTEACLNWKVNNRHGLLPSPTPREVQRTTDAPVYCFHWPKKSVWSCQKRQSLPESSKDWLPTKIAEHDWILPHKHERDSAV